jgi:hypothetical protein
MKVSIRRLRRRIREELCNVMIGYPFGNEQPCPEEPAGSMPPAEDHMVPMAGENFQEPDEVDGLDLDIFDEDETDELFLPVLIDPYVKDAIRVR